MAISLSTAATRLAAQAATVATAMGGGTTSAEVTALAAVVRQLAAQPERISILKIVNNVEVSP